MQIDRRRSPRIELLGPVHGRTDSVDVPLLVREMSLGGMAIETALPFAIGSLHVFRLTMGDESTVELTGRVMHCRDVTADASAVTFVSGVQFVEEERANQSPAGAILEQLK